MFAVLASDSAQYVSQYQHKYDTESKNVSLTTAKGFDTRVLC